MTRRVARILLPVLVAGGLSTTAQGACFEALGFIVDSSVEWNSSSAFAVSADGSVVVGDAFYDLVDDGSGILYPVEQAVMWKNGFVIPVLNHPLGSHYSSAAEGVSSDGSVIVGTTNGRDAWRWEGGITTMLPPLPSDTRSSASDVSFDGSVVVGTSAAVANYEKPVRWDDGVVSALELLPGGNGGMALGVSHDGSVIAGWSGSSGNPAIRAVRWQGVEVEWLGLQGYNNNRAQGISGDGLVVVGSHAGAFRWEGGTATLIGGSAAKAANADGSAIVGYASDGAFLWTEATGMQNLADLLTTQYGLDLAGWDLRSALDISADGKTIVGNAINPDGQLQAYRVVLEGPCRTFPLVPTMSPLGLALSALLLITAVFIATRCQRGRCSATARSPRGQ